ncbi:unnamed protein product [Dicrocoelium dendriticum]|nr:unnamed protein product [Dicrocoelium dendriticum]
MALNVSNKLYNTPMNNTLSRAVILREDPNEHPNEEEIKLYASSIGIDLANEPALAWIAKEGISAPLPKGWQVMQDENNQIFYYNASSGQSLWDHPLDSYYRRRVLQARKLLDPKSRSTQPTLRTSSRSSGRSSCSTFTRDSNCLAPLLPQHTFTSNAASTEGTKRDGDLELNTADCTEQAPDWADTPLLGEESRGNSSVAENKGLIGTAFFMSETELPTEYCELVPSPSVTANGSKPHSQCHSNSVLPEGTTSQTTATAAQTDADSHVTSAHLNETARCNSELAGAGNNSEQLQQTDPNDFQCSGNSVVPNVSTIHQGLMSNVSMLMQQRSVLSVVNTNRRTGIESPLAFDRKKDDTESTNHFILNSPACRLHRSVEVLASYPSLGSSPTESRSYQPLLPATDALDEGLPREQPANSHVTNINKQPAFRTAHEPPVLSLLHATNPCPTLCQSTKVPGCPDAEPAPDTAVHPPSPPNSTPVFNEGIHHLVEERARLQRKLLRIKLIYNSYKQRLVSLDSSIQLLQKSSTSDPVFAPHEAGSRSRTRSDSAFTSKKAPRNSKGHLPTITTSPLLFDFSSAEPASPGPIRQNLHHSPEVVKPEVVNIREDILLSSHTPCTNRSKLGRSLSTPRHTVSSRGSILTSRPVGNCPPNTSSHDQSPPMDLAHSLASIDAQLHRVINHLESGDLSITCDECVNEKHMILKTRNAFCDQRRLKPYWKDHRDIENEMQNLSLQTQARDRKSIVGDIRLLTPVSLEDRKLGFRCPRVDASPTWLQSD